MKEYWFYLEPYVYTSLINGSVFLYNTLDGEYLESTSPVIFDLVSRIKEDPKGVICVDQSIITHGEISCFIRELRKLFMGDIIDTAYSKGDPIQFTPILNIQSDISRIKSTPERSLGEDILLNLNELVFYLDNPITLPSKYYPSNLPFHWKSEKTESSDLIRSMLKQIPHPLNDSITITLVIENIDRLIKEQTLFDTLNTTEIKKRFDLYYKNDISIIIDQVNNPSISINIDFPVDYNRLGHIFQSVNKFGIDKIEYIFFISSLEDMNEAENIMEYNMSKYLLVPYYIGNNDDFFEDYVFIDKIDLLSEPVSIRKIFLHQSLNPGYFGKLQITPSGDVYSNILSDKLGSIGRDTLLEMLVKEFDSVHSWFGLRKKSPCDKCHYQWLCPPPGNYELLLKKNNLCRINNYHSELPTL